jgi:hypothetical protein
MSNLQNESDLKNLVFWVRPPSRRDRRISRAAAFAARIAELPFLTNISIFRDADETLVEALEFRRIGRDGLYIASLLYLGLRRDPIACLTLAGILAQKADLRLGVRPPNAKRLLNRALGWLAAIDYDAFEKGFGTLPQAFARIEAAKDADNSESDLALKRRLELNERRVTLINKPLRRWKSDAASSDRYSALEAPLELRGNLDRKNEAKLLAALREEYPWAVDLLSDIETATALSVGAGLPWLSIPPILIVGPPGIGKTRFVRRLSELTGVPYRTINGGGSADNRDFAGTARGWGSAHPSRIVEIFCDTLVANPIVLFDEIDKAGGGERNGRSTGTLLAMLEAETRTRFYDEALALNVDLSFVNWVLTANDVAGLGRPLLSRLRVVHMPAPPSSAASRIIQSAIEDIGARMGWPKEALPVLDREVHSALVRAMGRGASPRNIAAMLEQILAIEVKWRRST